MNRFFARIVFVAAIFGFGQISATAGPYIVAAPDANSDSVPLSLRIVKLVYERIGVDILVEILPGKRSLTNASKGHVSQYAGPLCVHPFIQGADESLRLFQRRKVSCLFYDYKFNVLDVLAHGFVPGDGRPAILSPDGQQNRTGNSG